MQGRCPAPARAVRVRVEHGAGDAGGGSARGSHRTAVPLTPLHESLFSSCSSGEWDGYECGACWHMEAADPPLPVQAGERLHLQPSHRPGAARYQAPRPAFMSAAAAQLRAAPDEVVEGLSDCEEAVAYFAYEAAACWQAELAAGAAGAVTAGIVPADVREARGANSGKASAAQPEEGGPMDQDALQHFLSGKHVSQGGTLVPDGCMLRCLPARLGPPPNSRHHHRPPPLSCAADHAAAVTAVGDSMLASVDGMVGNWETLGSFAGAAVSPHSDGSGANVVVCTPAVWGALIAAAVLLPSSAAPRHPRRCSLMPACLSPAPSCVAQAAGDDWAQTLAQLQRLEEAAGLPGQHVPSCRTD